MELFFAYLIKLIVIFLGGGISSLLAIWVAHEVSTIPVLIIDYENREKPKDKLLLSKSEKISSQSGLYEIFLPSGNIVKLFSSHKGMKIV